MRKVILNPKGKPSNKLSDSMLAMLSGHITCLVAQYLLRVRNCGHSALNQLRSEGFAQNYVENEQDFLLEVMEKNLFLEVRQNDDGEIHLVGVE